jgi:trimethylamine--corrinoid protein Co-methyltransferase
MRRGFVRNFDALRILTDTQVEEIHQRTLEILETTGVKFESERALRLLEQNGCSVDHEKRIAKLPGFLVEECIRRTPSSFSVKARKPSDDLRVGGNRLYFMPAAGARFHDAVTAELRKPTLRENDDGVRLCDGLGTVDFMGSYTPYFDIQGVEPAMLLPVSQASLCRNTTRTTRGAQATDCFIWESQLAHAVGKQLIGTMEAAAPLCYPEDAIKAAFEYTRNGFPIWICGGGVMGGTAPVTIAGSVISNNAELLAAVVFLQCARPGIGIIANDFVTPMDMSTGGLFFGSLGGSLHQIAFNQIWTSVYRIPTANTAAAFPNAKRIDYQNAMEKTHAAMASALSGANMIALIGSVSQELAWNPLQAILDNDMAGLIGRYIEGFHTDHESLAVELIKEVGPVPGTYLNRTHTRLNWKKEYFFPEVMDRTSYQEWLAEGKKTLLDSAREKMEELLKNHKPQPLAPGEEEDVEKVLAEAKRYYAHKGLIG